ncbi:chorismate mutase [Silvanigrella paludirubra]|uniref:chorismate mutase n=1 Tax=Silvanigrella paludirubra TaxID=2499159 RepID=UPI00192A3CEF|nr:chorismate mutase [Silvanigrella paludirubra]
MNLNTLRKEIEDIDKLIIECLAKRENISTKIGEIKREMGIQIYDSEREKNLNSYYHELSLKFNLDPEFILKIFKLIIKKSRNVQLKN